MVICLTSAKFNMKADILRQSDGEFTPTAEGEWKDYQDPITGEIIRKWYPVGDDPGTSVINEGDPLSTFQCMARGIVGSGLRGDGTGKQWGDVYVDTDFCRIEYPSSVILTKRDRVTNIRNRKGKILWLEEEISPTSPSVFTSTVFDVKGVTPLIDPFGQHTSNVAMLERATVQQNA
jgi:hypothetical protein